MSDSSRHSLFAVEETATYGVTPETPGFKAVRHTGTNIGLTKSTLLSEELRADRQIADFRHGTKQTGGDISGELSYGAYDDFFQAGLLGTWVAKAAPVSAATISIASGDNSVNDSANGLPLLTAGDRVTLSGFTTGTNNQIGTVVTSTAAKLILTTGTALVTEAGGAGHTVTCMTQTLKAGVVRRSFSLLRHFTDQLAAAKPYYLYTGAEVAKVALTVAVNAMVKVVFSFVGKDFAPPATTAPADSTFAAAPTASPMDSFSGALKESGSEIAVVTEISMTLENGIEPRFVIGSDTTIHPSVGRSNCSGQVTAYFEDSSLVGKFVNETESSLAFITGDKTGNKYRFTFPRIKYNGGQPDTQGAGSITLAMPFQALYDPVTESNLILEKL